MAKQIDDTPRQIILSASKDDAGVVTWTARVEGHACDPAGTNDFDKQGGGVSNDVTFADTDTIAALKTAALAALKTKAGVA